MAGARTPRYAVVGGGFYGCALALFLRSTGATVRVFEAGDRLMDQASYANQARVHTGFHYPRSLVTAAASLALHERFARDFEPCVERGFTMLYAIPKEGSKVGAEHFWRVFTAMGAPIHEASAPDAALFNPDTVAAVFETKEWAFNARVLRTLVEERLLKAGVEVLCNSPIDALTPHASDATVVVSGANTAWEADRAFVAVYDHTNGLLERSGLPVFGIKNERTEICLVEPPKDLAHKGITVMDGPFFSCMPFPSAGLHSLTHVRYTPRASWTGTQAPVWPAEDTPRDSRFPWMVRDGARYVPSLRHAIYGRSLYTTKAVLLRNEKDDGRPIALHTCGRDGNIHPILGGKIDNIYDLFDGVPGVAPECAHAHTGWLS